MGVDGDGLLLGSPPAPLEELLSMELLWPADLVLLFDLVDPFKVNEQLVSSGKEESEKIWKMTNDCGKLLSLFAFLSFKMESSFVRKVITPCLPLCDSLCLFSWGKC